MASSDRSLPAAAAFLCVLALTPAARAQQVVEAPHLRSYGPGDTLVVSSALELDPQEGRIVTSVALTYTTRDHGLILTWVWDGRAFQTDHLSPAQNRRVDCTIGKPWTRGALAVRVTGAKGRVAITHVRAELAASPAGARAPSAPPPAGGPPVAAPPPQKVPVEAAPKVRPPDLSRLLSDHDLAVADIVADPPLAEGRLQQVKVLVLNAGRKFAEPREKNTPVESTRILVEYRRGNHGNWLPFADPRRGEIDVRPSEAVSYTFERSDFASLAEGHYEFRATVDDSNVLQDDNRANNALTRILAVATPPLQVISFSPRRAAWGGGILLDVSTTRDLTKTREPTSAAKSLSVSFNGVPGTVEKVWQSDRARFTLQVKIPDGAMSGPVSVGAYDQTSASETPLTIFGPPTIVSFNPARATVSELLIITGTNFVPPQALEGTLVDFTGEAGKIEVEPKSVTETELQVAVPDTAVTGPVTVSTIVGGQLFSTTRPLTVVPSLKDFFPRAEHPGALIKVYGRGLCRGSEVSFGGPVAPVTNCTNSPTSMPANWFEVKVPNGAQSGTLRLRTPDGEVESLEPFRVLTGPLVHSFTPAEGPSGSDVVAEGEDLDVVLDGAAQAGIADGLRLCSDENGRVTIVTKDRTRATLRLSAIRTPGPVAITLRDASNFWSKAVLFRITPQGMALKTPQVERIRATGSPVRVVSGSSVVIEASNAPAASLGDLAVDFAGNPAQIESAMCLNSGSNTLAITVTVPAVSATGKVRVALLGLVSGESQFDVETYGTPEITALEPSSVRPGDVVTIRGRDFAPYVSPSAERTRVYFVSVSGDKLAVDAASDPKGFISASREELRVRVPDDAATGPVTAETLIGGQVLLTRTAVVLTVVR